MLPCMYMLSEAVWRKPVVYCFQLHLVPDLAHASNLGCDSSCHAGSYDTLKLSGILKAVAKQVLVRWQ